jgi:hypothetical protein
MQRDQMVMIKKDSVRKPERLEFVLEEVAVSRAIIDRAAQ